MTRVWTIKRGLCRWGPLFKSQIAWIIIYSFSRNSLAVTLLTIYLIYRFARALPLKSTFCSSATEGRSHTKYDMNSLLGLTKHKIIRSLFLADFIPGRVENRWKDHMIVKLFLFYFYMFSAVLCYWKLLEKSEKIGWLYTCWKDSKSFLSVNRDTITFKTWYINSNKAVFLCFQESQNHYGFISGKIFSCTHHVQSAQFKYLNCFELY